MTQQPTNRLTHEASTYLKQHAHNPVELVSLVRRSVRKSSGRGQADYCKYWLLSLPLVPRDGKRCLKDEEVAQRMNQHFVSIKVDREERPDVDQIYMEAVQTMGVQGGWPLNVFLTPDQKPFYGGTYFPKENWMQLLENVAQAYQNNRAELDSRPLSSLSKRCPVPIPSATQWQPATIRLLPLSRRGKHSLTSIRLSPRTSIPSGAAWIKLLSFPCPANGFF